MFSTHVLHVHLPSVEMCDSLVGDVDLTCHTDCLFGFLSSQARLMEFSSEACQVWAYQVITFPCLALSAM